MRNKRTNLTGNERHKVKKIVLITPAPSYSLKGNRMTATRWARFLKELGHKVVIEQKYSGLSCDLMIALHARRSFSAIEKFRKLYNDKPIIVVLTGTDLYKDIRVDQDSQKSLEYANRLVLLQQMGIMELPETFRSKARVVYQSAIGPKGDIPKRKKTFDVCVIGHLRSVKDPFRASLASRQLPASSRVRILHLGDSLDSNAEEIARKETIQNPRYCWLGERPHWKTLRILASCQLLVLSSLMEGGANVISEAIITGVPVLASKISGSIGMLGKDYPGYFPIEDTKSLADLILRAEDDPLFLEELKQWIQPLAQRHKPDAEKSSLEKLLKEFNFG